MPRLLQLRSLAVRVPLIMLAMIFVVESAIMTVFAVTTGETRYRWLGVIIDSSVLTLVMAPLMYLLIVRPLRAVADERSRLLAHMIEVQDAERKRVARDLHDEIGQSFTSLLVHMRLLEDAPDLDAAKSRTCDLREISSRVYDQIRDLARGLHPAVLDDLGLVAAVRQLAEDAQAMHGFCVGVQVSGMGSDRLPRKLETAAFRIIQESLTNCAKHAHARRVDIELAVEGRHLRVTINDDGQGFDADRLSKETFGLSGMRERALLLGGTFAIRSQPFKGTTITAHLPFAD